MQNFGATVGIIPSRYILETRDDRIFIKRSIELAEILSSNMPQTKLLTIALDNSNFVHRLLVRLSLRKDLPSSFLEILLRQAILIMYLVKIIDRIRILIFYQLNSEVLPMIFVKLLKRKTVIYLAGSGALSTFYTSSFSFHKLLNFNIVAYDVYYSAEKIALRLADRVVVVARELAEGYSLKKYSIIPALVIDEDFLNHFNVKKRIPERRPSVAYIGRLSREKGILEFVFSISLVAKYNSDIDFLIIGDGDLLSTIKNMIRKLEIESKCRLLGAIPHQNIGDYLNDVRLLVLPSYTEGLPSSLLEALACGTPVLVTPVGHIRSIIVDGKNGFLLRDNKPETIAKSILTLLPDEKRLVSISEEETKTFHQLFERMSANFCARLWKEITTELLNEP